MLNADQVAPLSSAQETLLRNREITCNSPGSILRNVDTMLDLVGEDGPRPERREEVVSGLRVSGSRGDLGPPEQYPG
jgi:hypothetical protein